MNKPCQILAVDDNHVNRILIRRILEERGMQVTTACNGREAVEKADTFYFDLILMDLQMPIMDGFDAARMIREKAFEKPILALSANLGDQTVRRCKQTGMDDFHAKPFQRHELVAYVEKWIGASGHQTFARWDPGNFPTKRESRGSY